MADFQPHGRGTERISLNCGITVDLGTRWRRDAHGKLHERCVCLPTGWSANPMAASSKKLDPNASPVKVVSNYSVDVPAVDACGQKVQAS